MGLCKDMTWMFCQQLSNSQHCTSRSTLLMEESPTCTPHFRSLSLYYIPQSSQNHHTEILISCLSFKSKFIMHNAWVIEKTNTIAFTHECPSCFLGVSSAVSDHQSRVSAQIRPKKQTNSVAPSPRANYTDWANATFRRNLVPTFVDRGVSRGHRSGSPTVVYLSFLDRSHYFSFK
jgi:hypothetical protein